MSYEYHVRIDSACHSLMGHEVFHLSRLLGQAQTIVLAECTQAHVHGHGSTNAHVQSAMSHNKYAE